LSDAQVSAPSVAHAEEILTPDALAFVADLQRRFGARRDELLVVRRRRRDEVARTGTLDFLPETAEVRSGDWQVAAAPADLVDRRVEITGPTQPKMAINALNSGAKVWLADLEDANTPHWNNVVEGQWVLGGVARGDLALDVPGGKSYRLRDDAPLATLVVRPRGWHFDEKHVLVDGEPAVGALVDFGLHFFHNAKTLLEKGSGPYFYLPKMESHLEARLWNDVFVHAQEALGIAHGTIRATTLIETIWAAFEMEEILYELRDHASGLNAGRWDYLFSVIKTFRDGGARFVLPDRGDVTMKAPMMAAYSDLLVNTCHRRGAFAMGGMAAFIPSRRDAEVNERAFAKVREDKTREANAGFDGSWVAHPDLVPVCLEIFEQVLGGAPNQLQKVPEVSVTAAQLLDTEATEGRRTEAGLELNVDVALRYLAAWLAGNGAVGIHNLMEDAATAEISRSQIWQWLHAGVALEDTGNTVTIELINTITDRVMAALRAEQNLEGSGHLDEARRLLDEVALADDFVDFLTLPAYESITR